MKQKQSHAFDAGDFASDTGAVEDPSVWDVLSNWEQCKLQEKFEALAAWARLWRVNPSDRLPGDIGWARSLEASSEQVRQAEEMEHRSLHAKAVRQAFCGVLGARHHCSNTACRKRYYTRFRCRNRYCPRCGPEEFRRLMKKYVRLESVVARLRRSGKAPVVAKLDFTTKNLGRMPSPGEVQQFNRAIRQFMKSLKLPRGEWGLLWCDEFGGHNSNLHAHAVYVGPFVPQKMLSEVWRRTCAKTVFAGSFIVSIKRAESFEKALVHALKYSGKYAGQSNPERRAELEVAFHGVRRVHTMGAFYNAPELKEDHAEGGDGNGLVCLSCGSALERVKGWSPVRDLEREGFVDLDQERRRLGRRRVFAGAPGTGPPRRE